MCDSRIGPTANRNFRVFAPSMGGICSRTSKAPLKNRSIPPKASDTACLQNKHKRSRKSSLITVSWIKHDETSNGPKACTSIWTGWIPVFTEYDLHMIVIPLAYQNAAERNSPINFCLERSSKSWHWTLMKPSGGFKPRVTKTTRCKNKQLQYDLKYDIYILIYAIIYIYILHILKFNISRI